MRLPTQRLVTATLAGLLALISWSPAGATDFSGTCSGSVPAGAHTLIGFCTVPAGQTWTLEPGANLSGASNSLAVAGDLIVDGAQLDNVRVDINTGGNITAANAASFTNNTNVEFFDGSTGSISGSSFDANNATYAVWIDDASPTIAGNTFTALNGSIEAIWVVGTSVGSPPQPLIDGNQFTTQTTSGGIYVAGTSQPDITGNDFTILSGVGVFYDADSAGTASGNTFTFADASSSSRAAFSAEDNASPSVTGNIVVDDPTRNDIPLDLRLNPASTATFSGNTIECSGGDIPLRSDMGILADSFGGTIGVNNYSCAIDGVLQVYGTLEGDATFAAIDGASSFDFWTTMTVPAAYTLTVPAGISLNGLGNALSVSGTLNIDQANITQVFIDYLANSTGSVTASTFDNTSSTTACLLDIVDSSPTIGAGNTFLAGTSTTRWLCVGGTSVVTPAQPLIDGNEFHVNYSGGGVDVGGTAQPTITNNTINVVGGIGLSFEDTSAGTATANDLVFVTDTASGRSGIYVLETASPVVNGNTIGDDTFRDDIGLLLTMNSSSTANVSGNTVACSGGDTPLRLGTGVFANSFAGNVAGNIYGCALNEAAQLSGTLDTDSTLSSIDGATSYELSSTLTVPVGLSLSIPAGISLNGLGNALSVSGTLNIDQANITQVFIDFLANSSGSVTASIFDNTSSTTACLLDIVDSSPTIGAGNTFLAGTSTTRWLCVGGTSVVTPAQPLIDGNEFHVNYSGGGVDVGGTAQPTITNNTINVVGGIGLSFEDTSAGSASANDVVFVTDTASGRSGIYVLETASPVVNGNTIGDDTFRDDIGLLLTMNSSSTANVSGNTVACSGGDTPLRLGTGVFANSFAGNVAGNIYGCALNEAAQLSGTLDTDSTLSSIDGATSYELSSTLTVPVGLSLSIPAGISLNGLGNALSVSGTLNIDQANITQVFIDYLANSTGSVTASTFDNTSSTTACLLDIVDSSPTIGAGNTFLAGTSTTRWLCVGGTSVVTPAQPLIDGNEFHVNYSGGGVDVGGTAQPTITNNTINVVGGIGLSFEDTSAGSASANDVVFVTDTASGRSGIYVLETASPVVNGNTIGDDTFRDDIGLLLTMNSSSTANVSGNTVACSGGDTPLRLGTGVFANSFAGNVAGNIYGCALNEAAQLSGTLDTDSTLSSIDGATSYELSSTLTVPVGLSLSIPAGISLNGLGNALSVSGTLNIDQANITQVFIDYLANSTGSVTASTFDNTSSTTACLLDIVDSSPTIGAGNTFLAGTSTTRWLCVSGSSLAAPAQPLITGNSFAVNYSGGGIDVLGTAQPIINGNQITINGGIGLDFEDDSGGIATGNTLSFAADVASGRTAIRTFERAEPDIQSNIIVDDPFRNDTGLNVSSDPSAAAVVTGNTVGCSGGDTPLLLGAGPLADAFPGIATGNSFSCTQNSVVFSGTILEDTTLDSFDGLSQYAFNTTVTVNPGATLTISSGVSVLGQNASLNVNGSLFVAAAQIDSLYIFANAGADFSADGMTKVSTSQYIDINAGASGTIANSTITGTSSIGAYIADAAVTLSNNYFSGWGSAVRNDSTLGTGNLVMDGNTFESNTNAIEISNGNGFSTATDNLFDDNTRALYFVTDDALFSAYPVGFETSNFVGGPARNLLRLPTTFNDSGTFPVAPAPYENLGVVVSANSQIVLQAGTVIASGNFAQFTVQSGSRLVATGTPFFPVVFTDYNHTDATRWNGLVIQDDDSLLQDCVIEFSGNDGLRIDGADLSVTDCRISDHNGDGIEIVGDSAATITGSAILGNLADGVRANLSGPPGTGPLVVEQNSIFGNGGQGINNLRSDFYVDGTHNYWGNDSGPFDGSDDTATGGLFNPAGQGQTVSDYVSYDPWIIAGPSQEGTIIPVSGDGQVGVVGETLADPLVVRIESLLGTPLENIEVIFSVVSGAAMVIEPQPVLTAANGEAQATIQLGLTPGEVLFAVTARDVNSPLATFMGEADNACLIVLEVLPADLQIVPGAAGQRGDVNADGAVNHQDAALLAAVLAGRLAADSPLVPTLGRSGDVNGDGLIDNGDVLALQGVQIGMIGQ